MNLDLLVSANDFLMHSMLWHGVIVGEISAVKIVTRDFRKANDCRVDQGKHCAWNPRRLLKALVVPRFEFRAGHDVSQTHETGDDERTLFTL